MLRLSLVILIFVCAGCASSPYMLPESDADNTAPGDAYTGAGMHFRKAMPDRRDSKSWEFYYKHCSMNKDEIFSRTAYECSGPFY